MLSIRCISACTPPAQCSRPLLSPAHVSFQASTSLSLSLLLSPSLSLSSLLSSTALRTQQYLYSRSFSVSPRSLFPYVSNKLLCAPSATRTILPPHLPLSSTCRTAYTHTSTEVTRTYRSGVATFTQASRKSVFRV